MIIQQEQKMIEGNKKKLLNSCIKEVIIYDFHKRLNRLRISVAYRCQDMRCGG